MHDAVYVFHAPALYPADPGHALSSLTLSAILLMCLPHARSAMVRFASSSHDVPLGALPAANVHAAGNTFRYRHVGTTAPAPLRLTSIAVLHSSNPQAGTTAVLVLHLHCVRWTVHRPVCLRSPPLGVAHALGV